MAAVRTWRREGGLSVKTVVQKASGGKLSESRLPNGKLPVAETP